MFFIPAFLGGLIKYFLILQSVSFIVFLAHVYVWVTGNCLREDSGYTYNNYCVPTVGRALGLSTTLWSLGLVLSSFNVAP